MASIFTRIINREIPGHIVAEDERFIAFLDINPLVMGHTLVIPKMEVDYLFDLPGDTLGDLMKFATPVAKAIEKVVPCARIGVTVIGLEVPHAHVHLIPINRLSDMDFSKRKLSPSKEELADMARQIKAALG
jgi:histidine triad (HIT) family protein